MSTEKMREEFESWQCNADDGPQTDPMWINRVEGGNGDYGINEVQRDWVTWQAALANKAKSDEFTRLKGATFIFPLLDRIRSWRKP